MKNLNLLENPITECINYRNIVKKLLPNIGTLDDVIFFESQFCTDLSSSEYQSSSTSPDISYTVENSKETTRPMSSSHAEHIVQLKNEKNIRPATASGSLYSGLNINTASELTSGQPVCGSIISRRRKQRIAWAATDSQQSISSSCSSDSIRNESPLIIGEQKTFPNLLPQKSIELELGVIGVPEEGTENSTPSTASNLLEAARNWRNQSQRTRETIKYNDNLRILRDYNGEDHEE